METFAMFTHLHNWLSRKLHEDDNTGGLALVFLGMVILYIIFFRYIIVWGANLI